MSKKNNPGSVSTAQHPVWLEADPSSSLVARLTLNQVPDRMSQMTDGAGLKEKEEKNQKESIPTIVDTDLGQGVQ